MVFNKFLVIRAEPLFLGNSLCPLIHEPIDIGAV